LTVQRQNRPICRYPDSTCKDGTGALTCETLTSNRNSNIKGAWTSAIGLRMSFEPVVATTHLIKALKVVCKYYKHPKPLGERNKLIS
jgi:hypothetical protein